MGIFFRPLGGAPARCRAHLNAGKARAQNGVRAFAPWMPDPQQSFDPDDMERYPDEWIETARDGTQRLRQSFRRNRFPVG
jgi:hypothetical protein